VIHAARCARPGEELLSLTGVSQLHSSLLDTEDPYATRRPAFFPLIRLAVMPPACALLATRYDQGIAGDRPQATRVLIGARHSRQAGASEGKTNVMRL
jgi:hypothetical protein